MRAERETRVTLSGDVSGEYIVTGEREDGSLIVKPDTRWRRSIAGSA